MTPHPALSGCPMRAVDPVRPGPSLPGPPSWPRNDGESSAAFRSGQGDALGRGRIGRSYMLLLQTNGNTRLGTGLIGFVCLLHLTFGGWAGPRCRTCGIVLRGSRTSRPEPVNSDGRCCLYGASPVLSRRGVTSPPCLCFRAADSRQWYPDRGSWLRTGRFRPAHERRCSRWRLRICLEL